MSQVSDKKPVERETVTLKKIHIHAGKDCKPGDKIKLRPDQIKALTAKGTV